MLCHYWGEKVGEVLIFCVVVFLFLFKLLKLGIYVIFITRRDYLPSNFSSHDSTRELKKKQCNSYMHIFRKLNKLFKFKYSNQFGFHLLIQIYLDFWLKYEHHLNYVPISIISKLKSFKKVKNHFPFLSNIISSVLGIP